MKMFVLHALSRLWVQRGPPVPPKKVNTSPPGDADGRHYVTEGGIVEGEVRATGLAGMSR